MKSNNMKYVQSGTDNIKFVPLEILQVRETQLELPFLEITGYPIVKGNYSVAGEYNDS